MVQLKKKVTLKTKSSGEVPTTTGLLNKSLNNSSSSHENNRRGIKWLVLAFIMLLLFGGYWLWNYDSKDSNKLTVEDVKQISEPQNKMIELESRETDTGEQNVTVSADTVDISIANNSNEDVNSMLEKNDKVISKSTELSSSTLLSGTLEEKAILVIRGNYGNGEKRRMNLGHEYTEIQNKVNEMYRNGLY